MTPISLRLAGAAALWIIFLFVPTSIHPANAQPDSCATNTGSNATILMDAPEGHGPRGYLRAYAEDDRCVGEVAWSVGEKMALPIWGDDAYSPAKDGLMDGETFTLKLFEEAAEPGSEHVLRFTLADVEPYYDSVPLYSRNAIFRIDSLYVRTTESAECADLARAPAGEISLNVYPNPATKWTRVEFTAPPGSPVSLASYDLLGRLVSVIRESERSEDVMRSVRWDASSLASGAYVLRLETACGVEDRIVHVLN